LNKLLNFFFIATGDFFKVRMWARRRAWSLCHMSTTPPTSNCGNDEYQRLLRLGKSNFLKPIMGYSWDSNPNP